MKQKIHLSLNESEMEQFRELVDSSQLKGLQSLINLVADKEDTDKYILRKVFEALSDLSGYDIDSIKEAQELKTDLNLSNYHKKALKSYFQRILTDLGSKQIIQVKECEELEKVSDCIKLVKSKV